MTLAFDWDSRHRMTLQERFEAWLATEDGQAVYEAVRDRALNLRGRGWSHFGIAALWEAARYDRALRVGPDADGVKVNNDYRSRMARLLMEREPELREFFEVRELQTA